MSDGVVVGHDPGAVHQPLGPEDLPHLDFVEHVFLPDARAMGCVTDEEEIRLEQLLTSLRATATRAAAPDKAPAARPQTQPAPAATPPAAATRPAAATPPSAAALWWARTREAVGSDLAVHGLAYIGVLLFFVGAFGLVVFAFADVEPTLRPVAELVIALAPFAAAALLLRRGATVVGRALEVAGGLLVPVMLITSFLDGCPVPPDLSGVTLAVTLTALTSLVAVGYAAWSARHPHSALRYLVAPVAWLAVGMATLGLAREIPDGKAVATPSAAQTAAIMAALVVTVALARLRPTHRLARPTRVAALPGLAVVASMGLLSWVAEGWPFGPVLVTGTLALVALELLADDLPVMLVALVEPMWWFLAWAALALGAPDLPVVVTAAAVAALAALGFLGILERAAAAKRPALALALPALGLASALLATTTDPAVGAVALALATVWAAVRRTVPFPVRGAATTLDLATALLPALALGCLIAATSPPPALATGGVVVLLATVPARWGGLGRGPDDRYWQGWWTGAATALVLLTTTAWLVPGEWSDRETWFLVAGFAVLTVATALGPVTARWRPPVVTGVATLTWLCAAAQFNAPVIVVTALLALLGLDLVLVAHARTPLTAARAGRPAPADPASLGFTGHAVGLVAIVLALEPGWAPVVAVALATIGFGVTGWLDAHRRSPVGAALSRLGAAASWMPLSATAVGIPVTLVLGLDRAGIAPIDDTRSVYVVVATAVAYALLSRLSLPARVVTVAGWSGFLVAAAAALGADSRLGMVAGLAAIPVVTGLVRREHRAPVMTWVSWGVLAPLAGLLAAEAWPWFDAQPTEHAASFSLAAVGSVLLVGAAAADLRGRPWTPRLLPTHRWALAPAAVGAADVVTGVVLAAALLPTEVSGWVVATASATAFATALLSRVGVRAGVAAVLGWAAVLLLRAPDVQAKPWIAVVVALGLLAGALAVSAPSAHLPWWARWDAPLLASAAPVASTALVVAAGTTSAATTFAAVGAECLVVAGWLRRHPAVALPVGTVGTLLVLVGADTAGPGWLALAFLGLSAGLTGLATRSHGAQRTALQVGGAVSAVCAWRLASDAWQLSDQRAVEVAAVSAALVALAASAVAIGTRLERSWLLVWGGAAVVVEAVCALDVVVGTQGIWRGATTPSWPVVAGLAAVAVALAAAPKRLHVGWLPDLAVGYGLGALFLAMLTADVRVGGQVTVLCLASVVSASAMVPLAGATERRPWLRPVVEVGAVTTLWALAVALFGSDDPLLLVPALAAAAVQAAAAGVAFGRTLLQMASPVLACAAWLVFSAEALDGNPQWVTVPIGLATLGVVTLWRRERREHGGQPASPEIVVLELIGIAFLVGAALVQAVTESVTYAVLAAVIGLGVAAWGIVSRVRRRVAAGIGIVLVGVVLLIGVPLWNLLLPTWDAASFWVLIGLTGLVALLIAGLLDRGRAAARRGMTRIEESTAGWE